MFKLSDNPHLDLLMFINPSIVWQEGGEAYLKAVIEWLFELCTEHPNFDYCDAHYYDSKNNHWYCMYRKDCPQCMQQLKEWSEMGNY
jgi:hypothetical protein